MNLNYEGSVAQRFMKFSTALATTEDSDTNIFNAISIYVPKSLASTNLASDSYKAEDITADNFAVITVTVDNYAEVLDTDGALLSQWLSIFNDGVNADVILYVVVFDDTDFAVTLGAGSVSWAPLTKAFGELYFISVFKTMFSEHYNGAVVSEALDTDYDDSNYFDMALALSYQCELEMKLSVCLVEASLDVPDFSASEVDGNACQIMALERGDETTACTTLIGTTQVDRAKYFWGYLLLLGGSNTEFHVHNSTFMIPIVLAKWFEDTNDSGEYVGNKMAKIRLSGSDVKPTGLKSPLNSDVNLNLVSTIYNRLDDKHVGYFISISDGTANNAELVRDRTIQNYPITAKLIAKWIDYHTSQDLAEYATATSTLTNPVLCNEATYTDIKSILVSNIQKFSSIGRITNLALDFPAFSDAKSGQSLTGTMAWSATYVDDLESVTISGSISF